MNLFPWQGKTKTRVIGGIKFTKRLILRGIALDYPGEPHCNHKGDKWNREAGELVGDMWEKLHQPLMALKMAGPKERGYLSKWVKSEWKSPSRVRLFVTPYSPWNSLGQNTGVNSLCLLKGEGDLPNSRFKPRSPTLQADSLPAEPQGKLKDTGVGSLSLLQWIFQTQESNRGLLHCRQILYQLSYQGSKARKHKETLSTGASRETGALPIPWSWPNKTHFELLTLKTVRLYIYVVLSH